jgi:hypothetical protein
MNRPTRDDQPTKSGSISIEDSVDASIAHARRVQHLSSIVMARLDNAADSSEDERTIAKAVVKALYQVHPHIQLEDALEFAHTVEDPPEEVPRGQAVEHVVDDVCTHLDAIRPEAPTEVMTPVHNEQVQA